MTKILDTNILKWSTDFTGSDSNTPKDTEEIFKTASLDTDANDEKIITEDNLGAQLRNIKSVVKGDFADKSVEKWLFENPEYLGRDTGGVAPTYLEKIQVDGVFSGSAIFSPGTRVYFSTNSGIWNTSEQSAVLDDNYREYPATIVKINTAEVTGKTVVYCQMGQKFIDCFLATTPSIKVAQTSNLKVGAQIYWEDPVWNDGYEALHITYPDRLGGVIDSIVATGDIVTMYKCAQPEGFQSPIDTDGSIRTGETDSNPKGTDYPNFDTITCSSWEVKSTSVVPANDPSVPTLYWSATMRKSDGTDNYAQTGTWAENRNLGNIVPPDSDQISYQYWAKDIDPIFITRHFADDIVAAGGTAFQMYVSSIKGDSENSGQSYRRISDSSVVLLGDGSSKEYKVFFFSNMVFPGDTEKHSPGYGGWKNEPNEDDVSKVRRYGRYSINLQVTNTEDVLGQTSIMEDPYMAYRPRVRGNQKIPTSLSDKVYQHSIYFTVEFEEALPSGSEVTIDYTVEAFDHMRLTPNGDPNNYTHAGPEEVDAYPASEPSDFSKEWDPDNVKE